MHTAIQHFRDNREKYPFSLNALYRTLNISKQAVYKYKVVMDRKAEETAYVVGIVSEVRREHPTMCLRDIYYKVNPEGIGRDRFESLCRECGLQSKRRVNSFRTTDSSGVIRFENLLEKTRVTRINQVWQSDITYIYVNGRFYYITFIIDSFSRVIVGYSVSQRLFTEDTVIPALEMALRFRHGVSLDGLIFHSDGGGQYYSKQLPQLTQRHHFRNSMCTYSWENGKAERVNGVIKNNYLYHRHIDGYDSLKKEVDRAVSLYNNAKPHIKLQRLSPVQFEKRLSLQYQNSDLNELGTQQIKPDNNI